MKQTIIITIQILFILGCNQTSEKKEKIWTNEDRKELQSGLESSLSAILKQIDGINDSLWNYKEEEGQWAVAEVVEHLILQDRAYYREIKVVSSMPYMPQYVHQVSGNDQKFLNYKSDPNKSIADWDVTPTGRFCSREAAQEEFRKVRSEIMKLITSSDTDFRQVFTFRKIPQNVIDQNPEFYSIREVRDLHQLVLNAIAHTERHAIQIDKLIGS